MPMYITSMKLSPVLSRSCTSNFCRDTTRKLFVNVNRCYMRLLPYLVSNAYEFITKVNPCAAGIADAGEGILIPQLYSMKC